jgi:hypothetical protein
MWNVIAGYASHAAAKHTLQMGLNLADLAEFGSKNLKNGDFW